MYILYSLLLVVALLVSLPWWLLRLGKYRTGIAERFGRVPDRVSEVAKPGCIWIHAVSVGEVLAVTRLIRELEKASPERPVFISSTTATGQRLARERFGDSRVFYAPLDLGLAVRPYLNLLRPAMLILAETEFWPNLLRLARKRGAAVAIVNARISDRSFPRYRRFRWFFSRVLSEIDLFLAQTELDAQRLREIGAPTERVRVSGNLKFDIQASSNSPLVKDLGRSIAENAPVIVCGSTADGEDDLLLHAFHQVLLEHPSAVLVLAPRHPERFDAVTDLIRSLGLTAVRRSSWSADAPSLAGCVFLLDSVGELAAVYALASLAFVGGSLVPGIGGHNILEPAQYGVPVLTGPHTFNFRQIVNIFEKGGGLTTVTPTNLAREWLRLLDDPEQCRSLGAAARELFIKNSGATARTLQALQPLMRRPVHTP
jgi:3-deoxy-D-manno-octulosonic-acid transferase